MTTRDQLYLLALLPFLLIMPCIKIGASARLLGEAKSTDLITFTCQRTEYFDLCMSTMQSYPDSQNTDAKGLALISLNACIAQAEETCSYVKQLKANATTAGSAGGDVYASRCLDDCMTEYSDALDNLRESVGELQRGEYESVNSMVSGAMTDSDTCEGGFSDRPGYVSPLTERNNHFSKLCSNSLTIAGFLS